jgi:tellurite resistance protein
MDDTVGHKASMRFSHDLVTRVRDLILERGGAKPPRPDNPIAVVEPPDCTPELRAILHRVAPMAVAIFLMVSADGLCDEREHRALRGAIRTLTNDSLDDTTIDLMLASFGDALGREGLEGRIAYVASQIAADPADREVTVELAAATILADGEASDPERAALELLAEEVGADPDAAVAILD